jgi:multidrug resistance efflux pump
MSADEKRRSAQRQIQIAAYEAAQAADTMHRIDDVLDAGAWRRDEVEAVIAKMDGATARLRHAMDIMRAGLPLGVS